DKAEAVRTLAAAEAEKEQIRAKGQAEAEILKAEAAEKRYMVDAAGEHSLNEARNLLSTEQVQMQIKQTLIENLPLIIRESVKPMEQIDGIKIIQVDGMNSGSSATGEAGSGNLADQVVNSALRYRGQAPLVDSLLSEIGLKGGDVNGLHELHELSAGEQKRQEGQKE
ncbi:flotillin family protein, partial [Desulfobulbus sp. TB]|nr:flotillin family protein [Desulfobulbus sp. TB]